MEPREENEPQRRLPILVFATGPGSQDWKRLLRLAKLKPANGWHCAFNEPFGIEIARRKHDDPGWYQSRPFTHYDHKTGKGHFATTYDGRRYSLPFDASSDYVKRVINPFDFRTWEDIRYTQVIMDLNVLDSEPARSVANGYPPHTAKPPLAVAPVADDRDEPPAVSGAVTATAVAERRSKNDGAPTTPKRRRRPVKKSAERRREASLRELHRERSGG